MNTPYSMALGWGSLLFAGGIAYYYAKKDINDRRDSEHRKRLSHTSSVAMHRGHVAAEQARSSGDPSMQAAEISDQGVGGTTPAKYRFATGNATAGRDRGDRL